MQKLRKQVKIATLNGRPLSLEESHRKAKVKKFCCSDFLASMSLLAQGECGNKDASTNARVVITDLKTAEFEGCGAVRSTSIYFDRRV